MGLSVSVGDYAAELREEEAADWLDEQFSAINRVLIRHGLQEHIEPADVPEIEYSSCVAFPYSFLHYLRRVYARSRLGKPIEPVLGDDISAEDEQDIERASESADSHLLYHSDCEGFYVPIDFAAPIGDDELPGGALGSTQGLLKELRAVAPLIDVELTNGTPSPAAMASLAAFDEKHPYYIERIVWHSLFENCQLSLRHGSVISFG